MILSSGVMWTAEVKEALLDRIPARSMLLDAHRIDRGRHGQSR